jgi:CheY-like chemotaxis protein
MHERSLVSVVDDDQSVRESLPDLLRQLGFVAQACSSAEAFLVGLSEAAARSKGIDVAIARADPAETARGYIHDFHRGALKLVADRERGVLIGATLVTPRAGEILGELVLAIKLGTPLKTLADVIHPFPAFNRILGESLNQLASKVATEGEHHEQYAGQL